MAGKTCQICGKSSGMYPLCKEHFKMRDEGLVQKNEYTGQWELVDNTNNEIEYDNETEECCVCGDYAPYGKQCQDCYYETLDYMDSIDKNRKAYEIKEYYYNLKNNIYRIKSIENKMSNCNKLIALALLCRNIHNDDSLISRVYNDIENLIKENYQKQEITEEKTTLKNYDEQKNDISGQVRCIDGHWVDSDLEREIDDMLYSLRKIHIYGKRVNEITSRTVKCDWFIPVLSDSKGIYIELWGMDTEDYNKNKEEKIKLYQEEELPLIQIFKKDIQGDKSILRDNLESEIKQKETELKRKK